MPRKREEGSVQVAAVAGARVLDEESRHVPAEVGSGLRSQLRFASTMVMEYDGRGLVAALPALGEQPIPEL